jgi:hypothetical protein
MTQAENWFNTIREYLETSLGSTAEEGRLFATSRDPKQRAQYESANALLIAVQEAAVVVKVEGELEVEGENVAYEFDDGSILFWGMMPDGQQLLGVDNGVVPKAARQSSG